MKKYTLILSDSERAGRGVRGLSLYWFLKHFVGPADLEVLQPKDLLDRRFRHTEVLFIGVPTGLTADHLLRVKYREVVLFDYHDAPEPVWDHSDQAFLRSLTSHYWKPWIESSWSNDFQWGCLPLRRHRALTNLLWLQHAARGFRGIPVRRKRFDVGFLGFPTALTRRHADGSKTKYPQRVEWTLELRRRAPEISFWGGLLLNESWREMLTAKFGDLSDVAFGRRRLSFWDYFRRLQQCRTILTPAGNARWTYRHYEAVYAGAVLLSTDLQDVTLLVPMPAGSTHMVPDSEDLVPFAEKVLAKGSTELAEAAARGIEETERLLHFSDYSRHKPLAYERFVSQLQQPLSGIQQPSTSQRARLKCA